jgi:hypothetical protein
VAKRSMIPSGDAIQHHDTVTSGAKLQNTSVTDMKDVSNMYDPSIVQSTIILVTCAQHGQANGSGMTYFLDGGVHYVTAPS